MSAMKWKYSELFYRRVCTLYLGGMSSREIARKHNVPASTVARIVASRGIQRTRSDSAKQRIVDVFRPDLGAEEIARIANTSRSYVRIVMRECGLRGQP